MTADRLIALLASIGACLSAIATFLTVQQMARQRRDSYRPDLALSQLPVNGACNPSGKTLLPDVWSTDQSAPSTAKHFFTIPLLNLGLGAAKNLVVSWSFAVDSAINVVNDLAQRTLTPVYISNENGMLSVKSEALGGSVEMWRNQRVATVDYILPTAVQNMPFQLKLPHAYITIITLLLYLEFKSKPKDFDIPELRVEFKYSDIGSRSYETRYRIDLEVFMLAENSFHATLKPTKLV
jgi:hypothetical protein